MLLPILFKLYGRLVRQAVVQDPDILCRQSMRALQADALTLQLSDLGRGNLFLGRGLHRYPFLSYKPLNTPRGLFIKSKLKYRASTAQLKVALIQLCDSRFGIIIFLNSSVDIAFQEAMSYSALNILKLLNSILFCRRKYFVIRWHRKIDSMRSFSVFFGGSFSVFLNSFAENKAT